MKYNMANVIGDGSLPNIPNKTKIDISTSTPIICESCGYDVFLPAVKMRKLSKLVYGGGQDIHIPFNILVCGECGIEQHNSKPIELQALESKDKIK
jgi:hypothetical protein